MRFFSQQSGFGIRSCVVSMGAATRVYDLRLMNRSRSFSSPAKRYDIHIFLASVRAAVLGRVKTRFALRS